MEKLSILEETAAELETAIGAYPALLAAAQKYDNKIMDKRFVDYIEKEVPGITAMYGANPYLTQVKPTFHRLIIWLRNTSKVNSNYSLVDIVSCERFTVVKDRRFNYSGFKAVVEQRLESYTKELNAVKQDIEDGEKRLGQYNQLVKQLNELHSTFSNKFVEVNNYRFNKV